MNLKPSSNFEKYKYIPIDNQRYTVCSIFSSIYLNQFSFLKDRVPSKSDYEKKVTVNERMKEDCSSEEYLRWAIADERPVLIEKNTRCAAMSDYEYKFWLSMTDVKTGYIKKQGKGILSLCLIRESSD